MIQQSHSWASIQRKLQLFTVALFTAKTWKQLECPLTEEQIKEIWHIYTMEYYSVIIKNETMPFATWMDTEIIILSKSARERHHRISLVESKIIFQMNLFTKQKQTHRQRKQTYGYQKRTGGRDKLRICY